METKRTYRKAESYIGETFNRLTILRICGSNKKGRPIVECKCSCGKLHQVALEYVRNGESKSCGCLLREQLALPTQLRIPSHPSKKFSGQTKEAKRASQAKWRKANPDKIAATAARHREKHHAERKAMKSAYFQREKTNIHARLKHRRNTDPLFKLECRLRCRIRATLKGRRSDKGVTRLVGCTIEQARQHIESLFTDGMSWDAFMLGKIHLDHVKPVRAHDLNAPEGRVAAFHYTNLQPLWSLDNLRKSDKLPNGRRARELTFKEAR